VAKLETVIRESIARGARRQIRIAVAPLRREVRRLRRRVAELQGTLTRFLGVGVPPPTPTWGNMLADSLTSLVCYWWPVLFRDRYPGGLRTQEVHG